MLICGVEGVGTDDFGGLWHSVLLLTFKCQVRQTFIKCYSSNFSQACEIGGIIIPQLKMRTWKLREDKLTPDCAAPRTQGWDLSQAWLVLGRMSLLLLTLPPPPAVAHCGFLQRDKWACPRSHNEARGRERTKTQVFWLRARVWSTNHSGL